jgi:hypothetical protein
MKARSSLILLFAFLFLPIFMCGTSEALTLPSQQSKLSCGFSDTGHQCSNLVTFESKLTVDGCLITPDTGLSDIANGYLFAYIPYSCKTLFATGTVKVTRNTDATNVITITSVGIDAEQAVNCVDGYRCDGSVCGFIGSCDGAWAGGPGYVYARGVKDSITDGDTMTLTQTVDVAAAAALSGQVELGTVGLVSIKYNELGYTDLWGNLLTFDLAGATNIRMILKYKDLAASGCPLLKGGSKDNPNTDFDG